MKHTIWNIKTTGWCCSSWTMICHPLQVQQTVMLTIHEHFLQLLLGKLQHGSNPPDSTTWNRTLNSVDVTTLNSEQQLAYSIIQEHHHKLVSQQDPSPLHMIVSGTAKSYLISAIDDCLRNEVILTGMAALKICEQTLDSVLQLLVRSTNQRLTRSSSTTPADEAERYWVSHHWWDVHAGTEQCLLG